MLTDEQHRFLETERVARFATADADGQPHVVPICYALVDDVIAFTIDEKPKRKKGRPLKRLANIETNPKAAIVVDRYHEDWSKLGWVMIQGVASILTDGDLHDRVQTRLRERYPQLRSMQLDHLPVVVIHIDHVTSWGRLVSVPARQMENSGRS